MLKYSASGNHQVYHHAGPLHFQQRALERLRFINEVVDRAARQDRGRRHQEYGMERTADMLDGIKDLGFNYAAWSGSTIALDDIVMPEDKPRILAEADAKVSEVQEQYRMGFLTDEERYNKVIDIWRNATDEVTDALQKSISKWNPVYMMAQSGARGNIQQISQLGGMRGIMVDPSGRMVEQPVRSNFREGLSVLEYFTSTHGQRKGLVDTALRTPTQVAYTKVDVAQDDSQRRRMRLWLRYLGRLEIDGELIEDLRQDCGRFAVSDVFTPDRRRDLQSRWFH